MASLIWFLPSGILTLATMQTVEVLTGTRGRTARIADRGLNKTAVGNRSCFFVIRPMKHRYWVDIRICH